MRNFEDSLPERFLWTLYGYTDVSKYTYMDFLTNLEFILILLFSLSAQKYLLEHMYTAYCHIL